MLMLCNLVCNCDCEENNFLLILLNFLHVVSFRPDRIYVRSTATDVKKGLLPAG